MDYVDSFRIIEVILRLKANYRAKHKYDDLHICPILFICSWTRPQFLQLTFGVVSKSDEFRGTATLLCRLLFRCCAWLPMELALRLGGGCGGPALFPARVLLNTLKWDRILFAKVDRRNDASIRSKKNLLPHTRHTRAHIHSQTMAKVINSTTH